MILEEEQKGLFTFYIEQTQQQTNPIYPLNNAQTKLFKNMRTSQGEELVKMPNLAIRSLAKFNARRKSDSFIQNSGKELQSSLQRAVQRKQKNNAIVLGQNSRQNYKFQQVYKKRPNLQYSNVSCLKAHLQDLKTHKKIISQKQICKSELKSLSMKKNVSQPEFKAMKTNQNFRVLRLQTIGSQIQKPSELIKNESMNRQLKKRAYFMKRSKTLLKSKMKEVKRFQQILPLIDQKQNLQLLRKSHLHEGYVKKSLKKYKKVSNPIKHLNEPYLEPLTNHQIKPFRQYLVNVQQISALGSASRASYSKERFSQNFSSFAAQKQVDCIKLISELRKIRYS